MTEAQEYAEHGRRTVGGWFSSVDARMFVALDALQRKLGVTGDLLEIGCYLGKSAILLGYFVRAEEQLIVIDLFGEDAPVAEQRAEQERWYGTLTRSQFEENYRRFHPSLPTMLAGPSDKVMDAVPTGSCRFIHIDGAHEFEAVRADTREAVRTANTDSVIVFDDVLSAHTPGVTASAWEAVLDSRLVPLAQSVKLYTTVPGSTITAEGLAAQLAAFRIKIVESHTVLGHPILEVSTRPSGPRLSLARELAAEMLPAGPMSLARRFRHRFLS